MDLVPRVVKTTEVDNEKTGTRFRKYRKDAGISVAALTAHTSMSMSLIFMLEQGERGWNQEKLDQLTEAVDVLSGRKKPARKPRKK